MPLARRSAKVNGRSRQVNRHGDGHAAACYLGAEESVTGAVVPDLQGILDKPESSKLEAIPPTIAFRDDAAAARNLAQVRERLGSSTYESLLNVLKDCPDADAAVLRLVRLLEALPADLAAGVAADPNLLHRVCLIFAHSAWLGETLIQNPDLLRRISDTKTILRSMSREEFRAEFKRLRARALGTDLALLLAQFRKREYVRILLRDVLGIAALAEVTAEISTLSDVLLDQALEEAHAELVRKYGSPRWVDEQGTVRDSQFAIMSLGKLGGNELNYSSDVDVVFLYDGGIEAPSARTSNREYFIELAQKVTDTLSRKTREGQVFRIDLRLRPQGQEGELAVPLPRAIQYYSEVAQDWELQAMIKARHSAGDATLTRELVRTIAPFVYRPNVNFAAVKTALQSRERIDKRGRGTGARKAPAPSINVKLDRGGIRDIEFLVQCLQRVYGGDEGWLRSRGTLFALQKLHDKEHISGKDFHNLTKGYEFLRKLEHHLQLRQGLQSHQLPAGEADLMVLAKCLGREEVAGAAAGEFVQNVRHRMAAVAEIYRRIVYHEQSSRFIDPDGNLRLQPEVPVTAEDSYNQIMQRLAMDAPALLADIRRAELSPHARRKLDRFLGSASTSSERYGAVLRSAGSIEIALQIFESSEYLSELLVRHPEDFELLTEVHERGQGAVSELFPEEQKESSEVPDPVLAYLAHSALDRREALSLFRERYRQTMLVTNASDLLNAADVWSLLAANSKTADDAVAYALAVSGAPVEMAVLALGRLGSREFDLLSDADVVFVADAAENTADCRKAAEQVVEFLTAYTREGTVFPVDARLRPQGNAGELVTTPARLAQYFAREAKPWEALTYLRLRRVAGSRAVAERALEAVRGGSAEMARRPEFAAELGEMRYRLEESSSEPNFKTNAGGTYDIDYIAGRLQLENSVWCGGNLADRVDAVRRHGLLPAKDARELRANATILRRLEHDVRLVTGRAIKWLPSGEHPRRTLARLAGRGPMHGDALEQRLRALMQRNRDICGKYLFD